MYTINYNSINNLSYLANILLDKDRKPLHKIFLECTSLALKYKSIPSFYISRRMYKKEVENVHNFIPNNILLSLNKIFNDETASKLLNDKLYFYYHFSKFFKNISKILMYNDKDIFIAGKESLKIDDPKKLEETLLKLVNHESASKSIFIKKTRDSHGGANTARISLDDFPLKKDLLESLFNDLIKSSYLFQETIIQHEHLNVLNPSCINTIRIDTFTDNEGKTEIIGPYLRMSICNLHVDNASSGGCFVGIDLDSGKLHKQGYTGITRGGGMTLTHHPITNVEFNGFQIPFFNETKQFVLQVASFVPSLRLIGWDIALTPTGPLLVEGNAGYDISNHDLIYGGYRSNPVFQKVLREMKEASYQKGK